MNQSCHFLRTPLTLLSIISVGIASPALAQSYGGAEPHSASSGVLQPNDQGNAVAELQRRLSGLGYYSGPITGYFDSSTQAAVSQFQQANGLAVDGIVGAATNSALGQDNGAASPSSSQASGQNVSEMQRQLAQRGYYTGPISGVFDSQTQTAVMNFQRAQGLAVDGIVGSATEAALYQTSASSPAQPTAEASTYTPTATSSEGLLQLGDVGSGVSDLQTRLQALGYYDGPISGSFGSQTQSALIAFQQAQGLSPDGVAGPKVNAALAAVPSQSTSNQSTPSQSTAASAQQTAPASAQQTTVPSISTASTPAVSTPSTATAQPAMPVQSAESTVQAPAVSTVQVPAVPASITAPPAQTAQSLPDPSTNRQVLNQSLEEGRFSVAELQKRLQMRGFNVTETTGVYDSDTQNAIMQAQQKYGLSQSDLF